jgi:hypothetical protein
VMRLQLLRSLDADLEESSMLAGNEGRGEQWCKLRCVGFAKLEKWIEAPKSGLPRRSWHFFGNGTTSRRVHIGLVEYDNNR